MSDWPELGTLVQLIVKTWSGDGVYKGLVLPNSGPNLVTIKLQNGYNISFPESYIKSFEILPKSPEIAVVSDNDHIQDKKLPLIYLIHTGGTIASKVDYRNYSHNNMSETAEEMTT